MRQCACWNKCKLRQGFGSFLNSVDSIVIISAEKTYNHANR